MSPIILGPPPGAEPAGPPPPPKGYAGTPEQLLADKEPPVCGLNIGEAWKALTEQERAYAHWMGRAGWEGARIIMGMWTENTEDLFNLVVKTFTDPTTGELVDLQKYRDAAPELWDEEWDAFLSYSAQVLSNLTNYRSFGNLKFIPRLKPSSLTLAISRSPNATAVLPLWEKLKDEIYSYEPEEATLIGKPSDGHRSGYYLGERISSDKEVARIQKAAEKLGIDVLNTRVFKAAPRVYTLLIASAEVSSEPKTHELEIDGEKLELTVKYGDASEALGRIAKALAEARKHAANEHQQKMIEKYIESFETGDIKAHIEGSRHWVKDVGPVVESYLGFIETYVDPYGARAEWEGFVAIVNKEQSAKFEKLVNRAEHLIEDLPWGKDFEVDEFKRPDFTALEILGFSTGGIPAGINIPNYYEVREQDGFKNVSLSNILSAKAPNEVLTFIAPEDVDFYKAWDTRAFDLQVANHELLGHGSGKLFGEDAQGKLNFDPEKVKNPLTGEKITTWYKPGQTPGSVLGHVSSSYEECRAESVALYLVSNNEILELFGYNDQQGKEDIQVATFLLMARAGVRALEFYDPKAKRHTQAHMGARLGITNKLIEDGIAKLTLIRNDHGELEDAHIRVDREAVLKQARTTMGKLLVDLQVRRAIADRKGAIEFYEKLTEPLPGWADELRDLVLKKKQPRKIFAQPNTFVGPDGKIELKEYETTPAGVIESFVQRKL